MKEKKVNVDIDELIEFIMLSILYVSLVSSTTKMIDHLQNHILFSYCYNNETVIYP